MLLNTIIFDFDGVIADTNQTHLAAWDVAYSQLTGTSIERLTRLSGRRTETIASILSKEAKSLFRPSDIRNLKESLLLSDTLSCEPIPGMLEFVALCESVSIQWGVASNSSKTFVETIVRRFCLSPKVLVTAEDVVRAKPAPDIFWHCANLLNIPPAERRSIVIFEDTEHGIEAALAAGMRAFGIATDTSGDQLLKAGAEQVFPNFNDAGDILQAMSRLNALT